MYVKEFIIRYQDAFGKATPLPIALGYSNQPASEIKKVPKCMIGAISKLRNGESLTLCEENVLCDGRELYTAFRKMPEKIPTFVSEIEHYKQSKEMEVDYLQSLDIHLSEKSYLNFIRVDKLKNWNYTETILFRHVSL